MLFFISDVSAKFSRILDIHDRKRLVCALVLTRVDYCNSALAGLSNTALAPLQRVFHAAVRFVLGLQPRDHVTAALRTLHWLPVRQRITYKLCLCVLMHGVAFGYAPHYSMPPCHSQRCQEELICGRRIAAVSTYHECRRRLDLERCLLQSRKPGIDCVQCSAALRHTDCVASFKRQLKTVLFMEAYCVRQ